MAEKIKINPNWDNLSQDAAAARNAGMEYGDFIAARYEASQRPMGSIESRPMKKRSPKNCKYCGGLLPDTGKGNDFCCPDCEKKWNRNEKAAQERGAVKEKKEKHCIYCGAPLLGKQKFYCDYRCSYLYSQEKAKKAKENREIKTRICKSCGFPILGENGQYKTYCSDQCKKEARNQRMKGQRIGEADLEMEGADHE